MNIRLGYVFRARIFFYLVFNGMICRCALGKGIRMPLLAQDCLFGMTFTAREPEKYCWERNNKKRFEREIRKVESRTVRGEEGG